MGCRLFLFRLEVRPRRTVQSMGVQVMTRSKRKAPYERKTLRLRKSDLDQLKERAQSEDSETRMAAAEPLAMVAVEAMTEIAFAELNRDSGSEEFDELRFQWVLAWANCAGPDSKDTLWAWATDPKTPPEWRLGSGHALRVQSASETDEMEILDRIIATNDDLVLRGFLLQTHRTEHWTGAAIKRSAFGYLRKRSAGDRLQATGILLVMPRPGPTMDDDIYTPEEREYLTWLASDGTGEVAKAAEKYLNYRFPESYYPTHSIAELRSAVRSAKAKLKALRRPAWFPKTSKNRAEPYTSHFGGTPVHGEAEAWPVCAICSRPLLFFLELDSQEFPETAPSPFGDCVLQVFFCDGNDGQHLDHPSTMWHAGGPRQWVRIVPRSQETKAWTVPEGLRPLPCRWLTGWRNKQEWPMPSEGCLPILEPIETAALEEFGLPSEKDKLGGWPFWVQFPEDHKCPTCSTKLQPFFQIGSHDNLAFMFGDAGVATLWSCSHCKNWAGISWSCF